MFVRFAALMSVFLFWGFFKTQAKVEVQTPFQMQISKCNLGLKDISKLKTYQDLLDALRDQYYLDKESTVTREVFYRKLGQDYKLKVNQDQISVYRIGQEGKVEQIDNATKQNVKTVSGQVKQILLNSQIDEDWGQYQETRSEKVKIEYYLQNQKITQMKISKGIQSHFLDCQLKKSSEVCYCLDEKK